MGKCSFVCEISGSVLHSSCSLFVLLFCLSLLEGADCKFLSIKLCDCSFSSLDFSFKFKLITLSSIYLNLSNSVRIGKDSYLYLLDDCCTHIGVWSEVTSYKVLISIRLEERSPEIKKFIKSATLLLSENQCRFACRVKIPL